MKIEQIYTGCLSQGAYYIESKGEAALIDPLREVQSYLDKANRDRARFKYIFETHFHADFVSGHLTLSKKTGAPIVFGPGAETDFKALIAEDGQEFSLGDLKIIALHTPGHTLESTCYLLRDSSGKDIALFTGDTLFLGDVGRPDLAQNQDKSSEDLAGILYDSLRTKIMPLNDDVLIYPAHGAGSACGKNMTKGTVDLLGNQKRSNYALRSDMSREEFVAEVTNGLLPPPEYFPLNVHLNKSGYEDVNEVLLRGKRPLNPYDFEVFANQIGALILDVRHQNDYAKGHIPQSIFIGLDGGFAPWVGALVSNLKQPLLLVCPDGREEEAITRLSRVGFDFAMGYLEGSFSAWKSAGKEYDTVNVLSAKDVARRQALDSLPVFDVRKKSEYESEHINDAFNVPLTDMNDHLNVFPNEKSFYLHCAGGYRSMMAASLLKKRGIHNMIDVRGGLAALKTTEIPLTESICSSKLK
ncbi:MAG: MBL fold metallo-hydrolase [Flavobacteriales bacterium]|nr:MBL fold metallo-hydrolase [Flavobacteriales bacterium]